MTVLLFVSLLAVLMSTFVQSSARLVNRIPMRRCIASVFLAFPLMIASGFKSDYLIYSLHTIYPTIVVSIFFSSLAILVNYFFARREENIRIYPQIRSKIWTTRLVVFNSLSWLLYLIAYEALFRGYLLFSCLNYVNVSTAIFINVAIYAAAHLPKGAKETFLSIPFGVLLCLITWYTQNIWSAVIIHVSLALSNDYFAIRANPEMRFYKSYS